MDAVEVVAAALERFVAPPEWLISAADGALVAEGLRHTVPELRHGRLLECRVEDMRLTSRRWVGRYVLTLADHVDLPTAGADVTASVPKGPAELVLTGELDLDRARHDGGTAVPFGDAGWTVTLSEPRLALAVAAADRKLRALPMLTDPVDARAWVEAHLQAAYPGVTIASCEPTVARYRPNQRCTVVHRLRYSERRQPSWPDYVIAKAHRSGEGAHAHGALRALADADVERSGRLAVARALADVPADEASIQSYLPQDRSLVELIQLAASGDATAAADAETAVRMVADALVELHRTPVRYGAHRTLDDELADRRVTNKKIVAALPELGGAVEPLLRLVAECAARRRADDAVPSHGAFRPAQVRLAGDRVGFLDLDGFGGSEPAQDLGRFVGKLRLLASLESQGVCASGDAGHAAERLAHAFLEQYRTQATVSLARVALWECLDLLKTLQQSWSRVRPNQCVPVLSLLRDRISELRE